MNRKFEILTIVIFAVCFSVVTCAAQSGGNVNEYLAKLPLLPLGNVQVAQFSSHSPHQQNGDVHHILYTDEHGDAVIFDVEGAGCVTSIWGTILDSEGIIKFYFDGENVPRYQSGLVDFFKGALSQFQPPLVSYDRRGYYSPNSMAGNSFAPMPFEKSLKITIQGKATFYHILYEKYVEGTKIDFAETEKRTEYIRDAFMISGSNPWSDNDLAANTAVFDTLRPWQHVNLLDTHGAGSVRSIELEMDANKNLLQDLQLTMTWDKAVAEEKTEGDKPVYDRIENSRLYHVNTSLGFFFGTPYNVIDLKTLPVSVTILENGRMRLSCYLPMPYWRSACISIHNKSGNTYTDIKSDIRTSAEVYPPDHTGYFGTHFRKGLTEYGRNWTFAQLQGTGRFLGVVQSCRLEHYCEGNEHFYIDGNRTPQINGTGTEDYYLGCFWPNLPYHTPFAGCVNDVRIEGGGDPGKSMVCLPTDYFSPAVYYRFHLDMPIPFYSSMDAQIQHGGENSIESEYASLAYFYLKRKPKMVQTDYLDIANDFSMKIHAYKVEGQQQSRKLIAKYEGNEYLTYVEDRGFYHSTGTIISFEVAIDPENNGIRLRRRSDQSVGQQQAEVYIDGKYAGKWYDPQSNDVLRWYDSEFDMSSGLTKGKNSVKVELRVTGPGKIGFTDFEYIVLSKFTG